MTEFNRYAMMMEALTELKPEIEATHQLKRAPALPPMSEVLTEFDPLPPEALFMGIASDGLPVLLNLHDPVPGPILIAGDSGTGKTALLQTIAVAAGRTHQPEELQFGILTSHPNEWSATENISNNVGIFSLHDRSSEDFILSLASWAHSNKTSQQSVLLLLDDLEIASNTDFDARQNLRWLLFRGPSRRVWPIVTLNPNRMENIMPWLDVFHTRVFSTMQDPEHIQKLDAEYAELDSLNTGSQFSLREHDHWIRFWIPSID